MHSVQLSYQNAGFSGYHGQAWLACTKSIILFRIIWLLGLNVPLLHATIPFELQNYLFLPSSAKQSKASASASAEVSLIIDSTHPPNHPHPPTPTRESTEP